MQSDWCSRHKMLCWVCLWTFDRLCIYQNELHFGMAQNHKTNYADQLKNEIRYVHCENISDKSIIQIHKVHEFIKWKIHFLVNELLPLAKMKLWAQLLHFIYW